MENPSNGISWNTLYTELCENTLAKFQESTLKCSLPITKMPNGEIFQPAMLETWQEYFYTTLYIKD